MPSGRKVAELFAEIRAKSARLKADVAKIRGFLTSKFQDAGRLSGRAFAAGMKTTFRLGVAAIIGGGALAGLSAKIASDAEEVQSKFEAVFKELSGDAEAFAKTFADDVGRSVGTVKQQLAGFQDLFVPLGFARGRASELSKELVKLTTDLSSFNNVAEGETADALTSALVGNHETVRRFGVIITQATLDQELFNMGIKGGVRAATEQQKVLARLNIIMNGTTDAQGDAIRTADGFANQARAAKGAVKDLAAEAGRVLLPALKEVAAFVRDSAKWLQNNTQVLDGWGDKLAEVTKKVLGSLDEMVAFVPKLAGVVAGIGATTLAWKALSAAMSAGTVTALINPVALLAVGLGTLAAAFVEAKIEGKSFADGLGDVLDAITGLRAPARRTDRIQQGFTDTIKQIQQQQEERANKERQDAEAKQREDRLAKMSRAEQAAFRAREAAEGTFTARLEQEKKNIDALKRSANEASKEIERAKSRIARNSKDGAKAGDGTLAGSLIVRDQAILSAMRQQQARSINTAQQRAEVLGRIQKEQAEAGMKAFQETLNTASASSFMTDSFRGMAERVKGHAESMVEQVTGIATDAFRSGAAAVSGMGDKARELATERAKQLLGLSDDDISKLSKETRKEAERQFARNILADRFGIDRGILSNELADRERRQAGKKKKGLADQMEVRTPRSSEFVGLSDLNRQIQGRLKEDQHLKVNKEQLKEQREQKRLQKEQLAADHKLIMAIENKNFGFGP